jgi:hypothetical protein
MPATVIVNHLSIVHAQSGGTAMAFPDVCKTPSPAGPVPIPYPNVAMSTDTAQGSQTVKSDGLPFMLKSSNFARSTGDEAGSAGGIVSGVIMGKAMPRMFSFDVKVEGDNVFRNTDIMLQNGGPPTNTPPFPVMQPNMVALPPLAGKGKTPEVTKLAFAKGTAACGDEVKLDIASKDMPDHGLVVALRRGDRKLTHAYLVGDLKGNAAKPTWSVKRGTYAKKVEVKARYRNPAGSVVESGALEVKAPEPGKKKQVVATANAKGYAQTPTGTWAPNGTNYQWQYAYDIALKTGEVEVKRVVDFSLKDGALPPSAFSKRAWARQIESVWDRKYFFHRKDCKRGARCACATTDGCCKFLLRVRVTFGAGRAGVDKVELHKGANDPNGWGGDSWWYSNTWWERAVGVPATVRAHEFGHLIGMYDEYPAGGCKVGGVIDDPTSIMNAGSKVYPRHLEEFQKWVADQVKGTVGDIEPQAC